MIPLYGFLEGDTIGLLILADEDESVQSLGQKLQSAASVRVPHRERVRVMFGGRAMHPTTTVRGAGFKPLDRFDVRRDEAE